MDVTLIHALRFLMTLSAVLVSDYSQPHNSTVISGTTFWSDSVYINMFLLFPMTACANYDMWYTSLEGGSLVMNQVVSLASTDASTICGGFADWGAPAIFMDD